MYDIVITLILLQKNLLKKKNCFKEKKVDNFNFSLFIFPQQQQIKKKLTRVTKSSKNFFHFLKK